MATDTRHVHLVSPLPSEQLLLQRVHATEELGRPFAFDLELLSPDPHLEIDDLLGDKMTVVLTLPDGDRHFNGHVVRIGQGGALGRYTRYHCTLRPFFWLLTRASDSRIYKKLSAPEIVKNVIGQFGIGAVEERLQNNYLPREYTVQYRESYFDFLSRLMEEEGIYYFFRHEKDQHVLVLCDDRSSHKPVPGYESIPFIDPDVNAHPREEHFAQWTLLHEVQTGAYVVNDFDFEAPRADLLAKLSRPLNHKHAGFEQYDPLAGYVDALDAGSGGDTHRGDRGDLFARVRLEELQAEFDRASARGVARGPHTGSLFELSGHPRDDQNRELLVVRAEYTMFQPGFDAGSSSGLDAELDDSGKGEEPLFEVRLEAQPGKVPFRPRRTTQKPSIPGPHAAMVVGSGEIWTDKYGRVKVHFPWDREDTEGCWIRVAQLWAGSGWGGLHVPRVGQEVIVEFIEGDPDRPIITGRVYNGANLPPFGLPDGATKSGILTRSSKGGSADTANELRFEDKKGDEQVFLHAEKNMDTEVENDQTLIVGRDQKARIKRHRDKAVDGNQSETIGGDKTIHVHGKHVEQIDKTKGVRVLQDHEELIGGNMSVTVATMLTETIGVNHSEAVGGAMELSVGGLIAITAGAMVTITAGGALAQVVGASKSETVGGTRSADVGGDESQNVGGKRSESVAGDVSVNHGAKSSLAVKDSFSITAKKVQVVAEDEIEIKSGSAKIVLKKNGDISIEGKAINIKGSGDVIIKGSSIKEN